MLKNGYSFKSLFLSFFLVIAVPYTTLAVPIFYSGTGTVTDEAGAVSTISMKLLIDDELLNQFDEVVNIVPGESLPPYFSYEFNILDSEVAIGGDNVILGHSGEFSTPGGMFFDQWYLEDGYGSYFGVHYGGIEFLNEDGSIFAYDDPSSPVYGQLSPMINMGRLLVSSNSGNRKDYNLDLFISREAAPVPEPSTVVLFLSGMFCSAGFGFRKLFIFSQRLG